MRGFTTPWFEVLTTTIGLAIPWQPTGLLWCAQNPKVSTY